MSNYDHRILKFLNQNIDRAPTITDMMTKLNISITDISDSLKNLLAQGLITRRMNAAGIECWSPALPQNSPSPTPTQVQPVATVASLNPVTIPSPSVTISQAPKIAQPVSPTANFMGGPIEKPMTRPEPVASSPKLGPVPVQHFSLVDKSAMETQTFPAMGLTQSKTEYTPMSPTTTNPTSMQKPNMQAVSWPILILCLAVTAAFSIWISAQMSAHKISGMQKSFVDQKSLNTANSATNEFLVETKSQVAELKAEVKMLQEQLSAAKVSSDSAKESQALADASLKSAASKNVNSATKIKPGKKQVGTKITNADNVEKVEKPVRLDKPVNAARAAKVAKAVKVVKPVKPLPPVTKSTPAKVKKAKSTAANSESEAYTEPITNDNSSSKENSSNSSPSSSSYDAGPTVPAPPGLDNQDLPPASGQ